MKIFSKIGWNFVGQAAHTGYVFLSVPLVLNHLGEVTYGHFVFLSHLVALTAFFDLGLSLKIYVDSSSGRIHSSFLKEQFERYLGVGIWVAVFAAAYGAISTLIGSMNLSPMLLLLVILVIVTAWPRSLFRSLLLGASREKQFNIIYAVSDVIRVLLILALGLTLEIGPEMGSTGLLGILLAVNVAEFAIYHLQLKKVYDFKIRLDFRIRNFSGLRNEFFSFTLLSILLMQIPLFWISFTQGELGLSLLGLLMLPVSAMTTMFYPVTTSLTNIFARHEKFRESFQYLNGFRFIILGSIALMLLGAISVYDLWYNVILSPDVLVPTFKEYLAMAVCGALLVGSNLLGIVLVSHRRASSLSWCYILAISLIAAGLIGGQPIAAAMLAGAAGLFVSHCLTVRHALRH